MDFDTKTASYLLAEGEIDGHPVAIAKPRTFVNASGEAVVNLIRRLKLDHAQEMLVVSDHIDLPSATSQVDQHRLNVAVTKDNPLGGQWRLGVDTTTRRFPISVMPPLNPETQSSADISYTQPLLQGFGRSERR